MVKAAFTHISLDEEDDYSAENFSVGIIKVQILTQCISKLEFVTYKWQTQLIDDKNLLF